MLVWNIIKKCSISTFFQNDFAEIFRLDLTNCVSSLPKNCISSPLPQNDNVAYKSNTRQVNAKVTNKPLLLTLNMTLSTEYNLLDSP